MGGGGRVQYDETLSLIGWTSVPYKGVTAVSVLQEMGSNRNKVNNKKLAEEEQLNKARRKIIQLWVFLIHECVTVTSWLH